jgi:hypothetical protein
MTTMRRLAFLPAICVLLTMVTAGCSGKSSHVVAPPVGLPAGTPEADSPEHLAARLTATWNAQMVSEYDRLLTDDFRFHFSPVIDPDLYTQFELGWPRASEVTAVNHLFNGYTDPVYGRVLGASSIAMTFNGVQVFDDTTHADSVAYYKRIRITSMSVTLTFPASGTPDVTTLTWPQQLFVVRSDAAVRVTGQAASPDRWLVRSWEDLASYPGIRGRSSGSASLPLTFGRIKSFYLGSS